MLRDAKVKVEEKNKIEAKKSIETINDFLKKIKTIEKSKLASASDRKVSPFQAQLTQLSIKNSIGMGFQMQISMFLENTELAKQTYRGELLEKEYVMGDEDSLFDWIENFKQRMQEQISLNEKIGDDIQQKTSKEKKVTLEWIVKFKKDLKDSLRDSKFLEYLKNELIISLDTPTIQKLLSKEFNLEEIKQAFENLFSIRQKYEVQLNELKKQFILDNEPKNEELPSQVKLSEFVAPKLA